MIYHQFSFWILLWAILYYLKIVEYPPSLYFVCICILFTFYIILFRKTNILFIIFNIIFHCLPLFIIDYKKIKMTHYQVLINIVISLLYILFMYYNNINIIGYYNNLIEYSESFDISKLINIIVKHPNSF